MINPMIINSAGAAAAVGLRCRWMAERCCAADTCRVTSKGGATSTAHIAPDGVRLCKGEQAAHATTQRWRCWNRQK